ncbi:hypothetical protein [Xylella fastidiosa]|uniref:hypothetical protein n=1 Tax=Xylella fastidiosa TaxID=2371 RepID=UPI003984822C
MMEIFWKVFIMLFVFPVVISLYAAAVHFLGAFIVRISPRWLVRIFAIKLWTTEFDKGAPSTASHCRPKTSSISVLIAKESPLEEASCYLP